MSLCIHFKLNDNDFFCYMHMCCLSVYSCKDTYKYTQTHIQVPTHMHANAHLDADTYINTHPHSHFCVHKCHTCLLYVEARRWIRFFICYWIMKGFQNENNYFYETIEWWNLRLLGFGWWRNSGQRILILDVNLASGY